MEASEISDLTRSGQLQSPQSYDSSDQNAGQLLKVLTDHETTLDIIKNQLRGELAYKDANGEVYMIQVDKPYFCKTDINNQPLKVIDERTKKEIYVANDEAINSIMHILKLSGMNPVAPMTTIDENEIRADLLALESKLAVLLAANRKKWGIDKTQYPMILESLKVLIKDARYRSKDGTIIKAIRTVTSRIEQSNQDKQKGGVMSRITSPFS